jgi:hypothetical protein
MVAEKGGGVCRTVDDETIGRMIPFVGVVGLSGCEGGAGAACDAGLGIRLMTGCIVRVGSGAGNGVGGCVAAVGACDADDAITDGC